MHSLLPAESPLSGAPSTPQPSAVAAKVASPPPSAALANLSLHDHHNNNSHAPAPPSYAQTTGSQPPALPTRNNGPPPPPPSKPVVAHARALYKYAASDARDVSFEKDDRVAVFEFMNADWWMGRNERTGQEGIFPRTYVEQVPAGPEPPTASNGYYSEKAPVYGGSPAPGAAQYGGYPPPPSQQQQNPYNSAAPPMAVANPEPQQGEAGGKGGAMGKKIGKKLGNAAIFGAGATIGSNIVNSIF